MKLSVDLVILDFDGVVIDSAADIAAAVNHTRNLMKLPALPAPTIIGYIGDGVEALIERSFQGETTEGMKKALELYRRYYRAHLLDETQLYPNVETTLRSLYRGNKKFALVTNKSEPLADMILTGLGVRKYFDHIVGPESVQHMKPNPQGILLVLDRLHISPRSAIMVGDTHTDIKAGQRAGTWTCAACYGLGDKEQLLLSRPDIFIDDFGELLDHLE